MRKLIALMFLLSVAGQAATFKETVDLSSPEALESLRDRRPEHYAKVQAILAIAKKRPDDPSIGPWIEARFHATDVELLLWQVSDPPKLKVSFALDNIRYIADVVPLLQPARPVPVH